MITKDDLTALGLAEDKATQALDLLGDAGKKLTPENVGKKAFDEVDLSVLTLTKMPKLDGEKTTDYLKRAHSEALKLEITNRTTEINKEVSDLKEKLKAKPGDEKLIQELDALKKEKDSFPDLINGKVKEWKDKAELAEKSLNDYKHESTLKSALPGKFKEELPKKFIEYEVNEALKEAKIKFDKLETGSDGVLYLINSQTYEKVKADDWFTAKLKEIIDAEHTQAGGGADTDKSYNKGGEFILPKEMSKSEKIQKIEEHIIKSGISKLDPRWDAKFKEIAIKNEVLPEDKKK
jgi:predicted CopG family antitoxin